MATQVRGASANPAQGAAVARVAQPCPPALEMPPEARKLLIELFIDPHRLAAADTARLTSNPQFKAFDAANRPRGTDDWAARCRFYWDNPTARAARFTPRIVFMGDSITENWGLAHPAFFGHGVLDRGISGQTSAENFKNNILSMIEIARANRIEVVLSSIPPAAGFSWRPQVDPKPWISQLNAWLRTCAAQNHLRFVNYYPLLAGPAGAFRADLSNDGVHPNRSGYRVMRAVVEKEILRSVR
ncbi:MAG TPA: GDSL-type esterase/lipase family protein [Steroidobacteraceae bacterium]